MSISHIIRLKLQGFSQRRVAYVLSVGSFALVPVHSHVSCKASGALAAVGMLILGVSTILCFTEPRSTSHRIRPVAVAFLAVVAHAFVTH
jgi:hypothetical protein